MSVQTAAVSKCVKCLLDPATLPYVRDVKHYIAAFRFGCLASAEATTVGINPAENECSSRPLPVLSDYGRLHRAGLSNDDLINIAKCADGYFDFGDAHRWFLPLQKVLWTINPKWTYGRKVAHVDVISCVTKPTFGAIDESGRQALLNNCRDNFLNTLRLLPPGCWVICDGKTAVDAITSIGGVERAGDFVGRVKVEAGLFTLGTQMMKYVGWNYPAEKTRSDEQKREVAAMARSFMKSATEW